MNCFIGLISLFCSSPTSKKTVATRKKDRVITSYRTTISLVAMAISYFILIPLFFSWLRKKKCDTLIVSTRKAPGARATISATTFHTLPSLRSFYFLLLFSFISPALLPTFLFFFIFLILRSRNTEKKEDALESVLYRKRMCVYVCVSRCVQKGEFPTGVLRRKSVDATLDNGSGRFCNVQGRPHNLSLVVSSFLDSSVRW